MSPQVRMEDASESDSDPSDMDPSDFDPSTTLLRPASLPPSASSATVQQQQQLRPQLGHPTSPIPADTERYKRYQCLYPVYFDATRSRAEGRRVGKELAVQNPLAREMVDAVQALGLGVFFEPGKSHPKDWSNPGRVRVLLKQEGRFMNPRVKNKHHLYLLVSDYLRAHPVTEKSPLRLRIAGMPDPEKLAPPAVPRGWKMGSILPLHSPALSGGGVSDNFLKEMMQEMQGQQQATITGGGSSAGGESKKKKDKKKLKG